MLSAGLAEPLHRPSNHENAFDGPPVGHPEKALLFAAGSPPPAPEAWQREMAERWPEVPQPPQPAAFDWRLDAAPTCPLCRYHDSQVKPVVMDVPEWLAPSDTTAIETIKRKLGINAFRGTIFDGRDQPAETIVKQEAPARLLTVEWVPETARCDESGSSCQCACPAAKVKSDCQYTADSEEDCPGAESTSLASSPPPAPLDADNKSEGHPQPVHVLRQGSAELDELAKRLEEDDRYAEADAVRHAAQQLRLTARELKQAKRDNALSEAPRWSLPGHYHTGAVQSGYGWEVHDE
jgi:hypothetical protein